MKLVVGLGNPGPRYARNRHNIGFMAVDAIATRHGFPPFRRQFEGHAADGRVGGERALLLKPATFMNDSGRAVAGAMRFYKLQLDDVIVLHDEIDLAPGKLRVKQGGGSAGHNGLRSIDGLVGPDYWRVRMGVGHPGTASRVIGHVLNDFGADDADWLGPLIDAIADAFPLMAAGDAPGFLNKVGMTLQPPRATAREPAAAGKTRQAPGEQG